MLGRLAAELELARGGEADVLGDLAVVLVVGRLRDRERPAPAALGQATLTCKYGSPPEPASGCAPRSAIGLAPTLSTMSLTRSPRA